MEGWRQMEKIGEPAVNNRDVNLASVAETPAHAGFKHPLGSLEPPLSRFTFTHTQEADFQGVRLDGMGQMYTISCTGLYAVIILAPCFDLTCLNVSIDGGLLAALNHLLHLNCAALRFNHSFTLWSSSALADIMQKWLAVYLCLRPPPPRNLYKRINFYSHYSFFGSTFAKANVISKTCTTWINATVFHASRL